MYPFIHLGPVTLGSYGLLVATGLLVAYFVMRADLARRGIDADAAGIIGITGLAGLAGARLYHLLETPADFFAHPLPLLFSTMGFAWFGAVIGGFIALVWLARSNRMSMLLMLDVASPAAALGYGIGRIGCLISGDGDYGIPTSLPWGMSFPNGLVPTTQRVHPTPIYEFLAALVIAHFLWHTGPFKKQAAGKKVRRPAGQVFAWYLIGTAVARFLVEFIRNNPRSFLGLGINPMDWSVCPPSSIFVGYMTNAQAASVVSVIAGVLLLIVPSRRKPVPA
jgi:phosphatidylglycerol:prolipoprotein diacylglycerol transferase